MKPNRHERSQRGDSLALQHSSNRVIKANKSSLAARYNLKVLRGLQKAIEQNPEIDIVDAIGPHYTEKLREFRSVTPSSIGAPKPEISFPNDDVRARIIADGHAEVLSPLSSDAETLLGPSARLSDRMTILLAGSDVLYKSAWAASVMVFRISAKIVVKVTTNEEAILNEHEGLSWLQAHRPDFLAPKPHGMIRIGQYYMILMSFIPGITLEAAWPGLTGNDKFLIKGQLESLLASMRQIPMPLGTQLGGVQNSGCKDTRRGTRFSSKPLYTVREFEDFIFSGSNTASQTYINLLRTIMPASASCVFAHGDIRPANIMVIQKQNETWEVVGLIDWESSGWYPEYWDCVKASNNLTPTDDIDWYMFLPDQVSPGRYVTQWALDRIWDRSLSYS